MWRAVFAVLLVGCLAACAAGPDPAVPLRVLQLNLCSSGIASCHTGRSTAEAAAVVRAEKPDLITLNEACEDDVAALRQALAEAVPGAAVASAFQAARDRRTGDGYRCRNGWMYGIGVISRWPSEPGTPGGGIYPAQDGEDPEERAWLCMDLATAGRVAVCTTHLAYTRRDVARAQCRYLFETVVGGLRARNGATPVVVSGDLNLGAGDSADLASCVPAGAPLAGDGGQQHVIATPELTVDGSRTIDLRGATDHPGLLVVLSPREAR
ncbi:endonuclease/exonuclease/phosphatase family protein [Actinomycetes bacterium KLBMP 9759]